MRTTLLGAPALGLFAAGCFFGHSGSSDPGAADPGYDPSADAGTSFTAAAGSPVFGTTRSQDPPPPPLSGGTLAVASASRIAVAADPDRDRVYVVDVDSKRVVTIALESGDEPGRVALDGDHLAFVALRRGGALVTIDVTTTKIVSRRAVCPAPRGVAYEPVTKVVYVACAGGELVTLPAAGGDPTRTLHLETDLRDVVLAPDSGLNVSRFRSAEVLSVAKDGSVTGRRAPADTVTPYTQAAIAWRMIGRPGIADPLVVHQRASRVIDNRSAGGSVPAYYSGDDCFRGGGTTPAVATAVTDFANPGESIAVGGATLPVDLAASPDSSTIALVAAGAAHSPDAAQLMTFGADAIAVGARGCAETATRSFEGQITSVAFLDRANVVVFSREPAALYVVPVDPSVATTRIDVPNAPSREDTGHAVFHSDTGSGIACASCHAEGGDDGLVWSFSAQGRRRTPSLKGTLEGTAPYHWSGDLADVPALVQKVYEEGMSGPSLEDPQSDALRAWLFAIPQPKVASAAPADSILRGQVLFEGSAGCSACHVGPRLTNSATVDVGTGGAFQVPPLVGVSQRAPYLHSGCATTLADRFGPCGGGDRHGKTSALSATQIADLVAYLSSL